MRKKSAYLAICFLIGILCTTGCEKELTRQEVKETKYYQNLKRKNKDQKKEIRLLEQEVNRLSKELVAEEQDDGTHITPEQGDKKALRYFKKIENSSLTQAEIGYTDDYCDPVYISNKALYPLMKKIAAVADPTTKYTPEVIRKKAGPGYRYVLYEENNSIFELEVYRGDYVIFRDLPGQVFHCPGAVAFGRAYLVRRENYPDSTTLHRMADSSLVIRGEEKAWTQQVCTAAANQIDGMDKTKVKKESRRETDPVMTFRFYNYGSCMTLSIYKNQISIEEWDGTTTWYKVKKDQIKALKTVFS